MKERPILFSAPMVRAILDGRKTQTRRIVKPQPRILSGDLLCWRDDALTADQMAVFCPFGATGDRLWVRETHATLLAPNGKPLRTVYRADGDLDRDTLSGAKWTPGIHMHRHDSRITLEITDVRVQRLQEISEEDALAEGVIGIYAHARTNPRGAFHALWGSINGPGSWDANPWVWAITFRRMA